MAYGAEYLALRWHHPTTSTAGVSRSDEFAVRPNAAGDGLEYSFDTGGWTSLAGGGGGGLWSDIGDPIADQVIAMDDYRTKFDWTAATPDTNFWLDDQTDDGTGWLFRVTTSDAAGLKNPLLVEARNEASLVVDYLGRVVVGSDNSTGFFSTSFQVQNKSTPSTSASISLTNYESTNDSFGQMAFITGRGDWTTGAALEAGDALGLIRFYGFVPSDSGPGGPLNVANIGVYASGTYTSSYRGADIRLMTAESTLATYPRVIIRADGLVGVGQSLTRTDISAQLHVIGSTRFDLGGDATGDMWYRAATTGLMTPVATSGASAGYTLTLAGSPLLPVWAAPAGSGSSKWNAITLPDGDHALSMASYKTTWTWGTATSTASPLFSVQNGTNDTGTGYLMTVATPGTNSKHPFAVFARGGDTFIINREGGVGINVGVGAIPTSASLTVRAPVTVGQSGGPQTLKVYGDGNFDLGNDGFIDVNQSTLTYPLNIGLNHYNNSSPDAAYIYFRKAGGTQSSIANAPTNHYAGGVIWQSRISGSFTEIAGIRAQRDGTGSDYILHLAGGSTDLCVSHTYGVKIPAVGLDGVSAATGDTWYRDANGYMRILPIGTTGQVLKVTSGLPAWGASGGSPGGSDTQVQFNDASAFNGSSSMTWNNTAKRLKIGLGDTTSVNFSQVATPYAVLLTEGTSATPATGASPTLSIMKRWGAQSTSGVGAGFHLEVANDFVPPGAGLGMSFGQCAAIIARSNQRIDGDYIGLGVRMIAEGEPGTNTSMFATWHYVEKTSRLSALGFEASFNNQYSRTVTAASNTAPIAITTSAAHYLTTGDEVVVQGVGGNTAANTLLATVTVLSSTQFLLNGIAGNGTYTSGGTVYLHSSRGYNVVPTNRGMAGSFFIGAGSSYGNATSLISLGSGDPTRTRAWVGIEMTPLSVSDVTKAAIRMPFNTYLGSWSSTASGASSDTSYHLIGLGANNIVTIDPDGRSSIFGANVQINSGLSALPIFSASLLVYGSSDKERIEVRSVGTGAPIFMSKRSRGTIGSFAVPQSTDVIGGFGASGYDAGSGANHDTEGWYTSQAGAIFFIASETWSSTAHGNYATIQTTANGATSRAERVKIDDTVSLFNQSIKTALASAGHVFINEGNAAPSVRAYGYASTPEANLYYATAGGGAIGSSDTVFGRVQFYYQLGSPTLAGAIIGQQVSGEQGITIKGTNSNPSISIFTNLGMQINVDGSGATGDLLYRKSDGYLARLGIGSAGQVLTVASGLPAWAASSGSGTWNSISSPAGNQSLAMAAYTSTWTWNNTSGSDNLLTLTNTSNNAGTGYLLSLETPGGANATKPLRIVAQGGEIMHIDADGKFVFGSTVSLSSLGLGTAAPIGLVANSSTGLMAFSAGTSFVGPRIQFAKSSNIPTVPQAVAANHLLGSLEFFAHDGSGFLNSASIQVLVDGTPGTNDMPTLIRFNTTADGSSSSSTRMTIKNDGKVGINNSSPSALFHVSGTARFDVGSDATGDLHYRDASGFFTRLGIGSSGQVLTVSGGLPAWGTGGAGGGYATVQDEGSGLTARTTMNFIGAAVSAADDAGNSRTNVTISSPTLSGSDNQLAYRSSSTNVATVSGSAVSGANLTLGGKLTISPGSAGTTTVNDSSLGSNINTVLSATAGQFLAPEVYFYKAGSAGANINNTFDSLGSLWWLGKVSGSYTTLAFISVSRSSSVDTMSFSAGALSFSSGSGNARFDLAANALETYGVVSSTAGANVIRRYDLQSSGTPADGWGLRTVYQLESTTTASREAASFDILWQESTDASRSAMAMTKTAHKNQAAPNQRQILGIYRDLTDNTATDIFSVVFGSTDHKAVAGMVHLTIFAKQVSGSNQIQAYRKSVPFVAVHNAANNVGYAYWGGEFDALGLVSTGSITTNHSGGTVWGYTCNGTAFPTAASGANTFTFALRADTDLTASEFYVIANIDLNGDIDVTIAS